MATPAKVRKRTPSFLILFSGDDEKRKEILDTMQKIKNELTRRENKNFGNIQTLEYLFGLFNQTQGGEGNGNDSSNNRS